MTEIPSHHYGRDPAEIMERRQEATCLGCQYADKGRYRMAGRSIECTYCTRSENPKCQQGAGKRCEHFSEGE